MTKVEFVVAAGDDTKKVVSQVLFEELRDKIISGKYPANTRLPSERDMVASFGVNRGAVREAIQRLAQAGLVSVQHGGGTRVLNYLENGGLELLFSLIVVPAGPLNFVALRSLIEMRTAFGVDAAGIAAQRRSAEDLEFMAEKLGVIEGVEDPDQLRIGVNYFWDALIHGSGNIAYQLAFNTVKKTYRSFTELTNQVVAESFDIDDYRRLYEAIKAKEVSRSEAEGRVIVEKDAKASLEIFSRSMVN